MQHSDIFPALLFFKLLRQSEEHVYNQKLREQEFNLCVHIWQ